ncbi:hypothetical protein MMC25_006002 [Agyrium rufum]|nr:hypothetical protein [Agyrium rufum]
MDEAGPSQAFRDHARSTRSRASSVISTGTKTSIGTFGTIAQQEERGSGMDVLLGQRNFRITTRPGSIISISSFDRPAPPYEMDNPSTPVQLPSNLSFPLAPGSEQLLEDSSEEQPDERQVNRRQSHKSSRLTLQSTPSSTAETHSSGQPSSRDVSPPSPPFSPVSVVDPENIISQHYTRVVRTIDANHQAEIDALKSAHASEIAHLRHEIDQAYRKEFRAKVAQVEKIREESARAVSEVEERCMEELERKSRTLEEVQGELEEVEARLEREWMGRVERERNAVEDLWEGRWKDRARVLRVEALAERERVGVEVREAVRRRDGWWRERLVGWDGDVARRFLGAVEGELRELGESGERE